MGAIAHEEAQVPDPEYGHRDMYKARANPASLMNGLFWGGAHQVVGLTFPWPW